MCFYLGCTALNKHKLSWKITNEQWSDSSVSRHLHKHLANVYVQHDENNGTSTIVNYKYGDTEIGTHTIKLMSNN